jgi:mono/diheme cytochrome c family protein
MSMNWRLGLGVAAIVWLAAAGAPGSAAQGRGAAQEPRSLLIESMTGADTYGTYCAGCHGQTGRGNGPIAPLLKTRPPDLTSLAARNGGTYPRARVAAAVANTERPITAHGTGEMPVWGTIFRALDPNDARVQVRIDNVVGYVATLQEPLVITPEVGRELFMANCASCHGPNGRGGGTLASQLRHEVPDLTTFAMRNGGMFPSVRVRRIIDGTGIASHGTREMPVWGTVFRRQRGVSEALAAARIDAVTQYLESIQLRTGE